MKRRFPLSSTYCSLLLCSSPPSLIVVQQILLRSLIMLSVEVSPFPACFRYFFFLSIAKRKTHGHIDHVSGLSETKKQLHNALIHLHSKEKVRLCRSIGHRRQVQYYGAPLAGKLYGIPCPMPPSPDVLIEEGQVLSVGSLRFQVLLTPGLLARLVVVDRPGHSPGHVCFYEENEKVIFVGDVVFRKFVKCVWSQCLTYSSVGRTDLPLASGKDMIASLKRLMKLPHDVTVFPGHMEITTFGAEHASNPYFQNYRE
jgi:hydroxyacylglutathione hydrolase